jgi:hypothetical protein
MVERKQDNKNDDYEWLQIVDENPNCDIYKVRHKETQNMFMAKKLRYDFAVHGKWLREVEALERIR